MKKLLSIISAIMITSTAFLFAQTAATVPVKPRTPAQLKQILMKEYSLPLDSKVVSIGMVQNDSENNYQIAHVTRFWSMPYSPLKHSRYELVVFEGDNAIGCYSNFIETKPLIKGNKAIFNGIDSTLGNEIDFSAGVPLMVTINGETYMFKKIDFVTPAYEEE